MSIDFDQEFLETCFLIDQLMKNKYGKDAIVVDSYFGDPPKPKTAGDWDTALEKLIKLQTHVESFDDPYHRNYLTKQLLGLRTQVELGLEKKISYIDQVQRMLEVNPVRPPKSDVVKLQKKVIDELRVRNMKGDPEEEITKWRKAGEIPGDKLIPIITKAADLYRSLTKEHVIDLPEGETTEFKAVTDAPWGAYHYYKKGYKSLVEINTKFPVVKYTIKSWVTHETYPGHQTQLSRREMLYRKNKLGLESTLSLVNVPESTIAEGLAECGGLFLNLEKDENEMLRSALGRLGRLVGKNAAFMLNQDQLPEEEVAKYIAENTFVSLDRAKARIPFMVDPIWRTYVFTYDEGWAFVSDLFHKAKENGKQGKFFKILYSELHVPSTLQQRCKDLEIN
ncbi:MAG: hypothetical protein ACXACA_07790 [Candidatus Ranarchaeia archaeon]